MVDQYIFRLHAGEPVVYFDHDNSVRNNNRVLDAGGVVLSLSTEGLIMEDSIGRSIYVDVAPSVTRMCLWGNRQSEILSKVLPNGMADRIEVTGHPSFDLLNEGIRDYYHDEEIIAEHGKDYVLVNTNFSLFNMKMDLKRYLSMLGRMQEWKIYQAPEVQTAVWASKDYQQKVFRSFIELVRFLSAQFPDRHVILRPHPMERREPYDAAFAGLSNVFVRTSGSVRRWIAAAGCVIHHDCTTGMEALLMDKLVVRYQSVFDEAHTCRLQASIGVNARTREEVGQAIATGRMSRDALDEQLDLLSPFLANLGFNSADRLARLAASLAEGRPTWKPDPLGLTESFKCWRKHLSKLIRANQPGHNGRKVRYALEKFPRIPVSYVQECVRRFREVDPDLPEVRLRHLALNTYFIEPH